MAIKTLYVFLILGITVFTSACHKDGNAVIEGYVYEKGTNTPFANVGISLRRSYHFNTAFPYGYTTTDNNGYFKLRYKRSLLPGYQHYLGIFTDNSYDFYTEDIKDRKNKLNIELTPVAFTKLRAINNLPYDVTLTAYIGTRKYNSFNKIVRAGNDTVFNDLYKINGNGYTDISWYYIWTNPNNQSSKINSDRIYHSVPKDTIIYQIQIN